MQDTMDITDISDLQKGGNKNADYHGMDEASYREIRMPPPHRALR